MSLLRLPRFACPPRAGIVVLALACALGAGRCGGSGGGATSGDVTLPGDVTQLCSVEGFSNVYTPGTKAQTAVSTPRGTRLQSIAVDQKYVVIEGNCRAACVRLIAEQMRRTRRCRSDRGATGGRGGAAGPAPPPGRGV